MSKKTNSPKRGNQYFRQEHEDMIVSYALAKNKEEKNKIFNNGLSEVLETLIDRIVQTYDFWKQLPTIEEDKMECLAYVVFTLDKYDPSRGKKAFSYFTVVIKRFFLQKVNKLSRKRTQEIRNDQYLEYESKLLEEKKLDYETERTRKDFSEQLIGHFEKWVDKRTSKIDKSVGKAVIVILEDQLVSEDPQMDLILNKKAINVYLKSITGIESTQGISTSLKKIKKSYVIFKRKWNRGDF